MDICTFGKDEEGNRIDEVSSTVVLKRGDDLKQDRAVIDVFKFMNYIWEKENVNYQGTPVSIFTYDVVPMGPNMGVLEFVEGCTPLRDAAELHTKLDPDSRKHLVATAVASYIGGYILGLRDRHFDNILLSENGTLFHIDFGHVFGSRILFDTANIAVTRDLLELMGEQKWGELIVVAIRAYQVLRQYAKEIIHFTDLAFHLIHPTDFIRKFMWDSFKMDSSEPDAMAYIASEFTTAPKRMSTKIKNTFHRMATAEFASSS